MAANYKNYTIKVHYNGYNILDSKGSIIDNTTTIFNALNIIDNLSRV